MAQATVSLNVMTQKLNKSLYIYVYHYNRLNYVAIAKIIYGNTDSMRKYHFVASINNVFIVDKIAKQVRDTPRVLLDPFKKA